MLHTRIWRLGRAMGLAFTVAALAACGARTVVPPIGDAAVDAASEAGAGDAATSSQGATVSTDAAIR